MTGKVEGQLRHSFCAGNTTTTTEEPREIWYGDQFERAVEVRMRPDESSAQRQELRGFRVVQRIDPREGYAQEGHFASGYFINIQGDVGGFPESATGAFTFNPEDVTYLFTSQSPSLIEKTAGVSGGEACVRNTRIPVWILTRYFQLGASDNEVLRSFPSLGRSDLEAARRYYADHKWEIDRAIEREEAE